MDTFFFIPASKHHKIDDILKLGVEHIIIDFEDSVLEKDRLLLFEEIKAHPFYKNFWYRIPFRSDFKDNIDLTFLKLFQDNEIENFVFPKLKDIEEVVNINNFNLHKTSCILLVEHPRLLFDLEQILRRKLDKLEITGIGLGSHDLTSVMNTSNNDRVLNYPKSYLSYLSKAFGIINIDVASMELKDFTKFSEEIEIAHEFACEAKFLIHPIQLEWMKSISSKSQIEIEWAQSIINALPQNVNPEEIEPFVLQGKIIEKMHIKNALNTLKENKDGK